jgi:5'-nucleotidase
MSRVWRLFALFALIVLSLPTISHAAGARSLTVLHTANTFNRIQEFKPFKQGPQGGVARRATVLKELRAAHPNSILVSGGNDVMGTPMFAQYGGVASGEVMSRLKYDVALANQMDIMAGGTLEGFKAYQSVATYPLLNANLDLSNLPDVKVPANTVLNVNGIKVGVFALSNERAVSLANFGQSISVLDTDKVIEQNLAELNKQNVDIILLISALGVDRDKAVAEKYGGPKGIDIIVGNASGAILGDPADLPKGSAPIGPYPMVINEKTNPVALVYGGQFGTFLGELNVEFDDSGKLTSWGGKLHFLGEDVKPDPDMQKYVDELAAGIVMDKIVLGETSGELFGSFQDYPWQENPLADLYADAFLEYGQPLGAQISLVNSGAVWGTLNAGKITLADLYRIQPFTNWLIIMDLKGSQLLAALENGVSKYGESASQGSGRFLAVAGMTYAFDPSKEVGHRITDVKIGDKPLDPAATYTVAVNDFMANGGDDFTMLREGSNVFNTGISITDLLQQYIKVHSPFAPTANGRVKDASK